MFFNRFAEVERSYEAVEEPISSLREGLERAQYQALEQQWESERIEKFNRNSQDQASDDG